MSAIGNRHAAAFAPFLLSARHLRQTLAPINAPNEPRQSKAAIVKHRDFAAVERVVAAYFTLETEAVRIGDNGLIEGCDPGAIRHAMAVLSMSAAHERFLMVIRKAILDLKSKSHKLLRDRLAEYANYAQSRGPRLLAEIGRALSTALLVV